MFKRYSLTFLALLSLVLTYFVTLLPIVILGNGLESGTYILAVLTWGSLVLLSLFPALSLIIRNIWFFEGQNKTVSQKELQSIILAVNQGNNPIYATAKKKKILLSWRYEESEWCKHMQKAGLQKLYELKLTFHAPTKTVFLSDRVRSFEILICTDQIKKGLFPLYRPYFKVSLRQQLTLKTLQGKPAHEYMFQPKEIKSPVIGSILKNGWNVRFNLT